MGRGRGAPAQRPGLGQARSENPEGVSAGQQVVACYAVDDTDAEAAELLRTGGWEPVRVRGIDQTARIEVFGELHPFGGLEGRRCGGGSPGRPTTAGPAA